MQRTVIRVPTPQPAMNLATRNMATLTLPAHRIPPTIVIRAPSSMLRSRPILFAVQAVTGAARALPAELRPLKAPIRFDVR